MMKKTLFIVFGLALVCASNSFSQSLDMLVEKAVDNLVVARNTAVVVSIEAITLRNTQTVSSLSVRLYDLIRYYAGKNGKYRVTIPSPETPPSKRGAPSVIPNKLDSGRIVGSYSLQGDVVEIMLSLILNANNQQIAIDKFSIPLAELERLGLKVLPDNIASPEEAVELEEILAPEVVEIPVVPPAIQPVLPPVEKKGLTLNVWPDHDSRVYYEGEQMTIKLWSDHDCYFIVYHVDVNQLRQVIFPNQYDKGSNFLKADTIRTIPIEGSQFDICAPFGEERILVEASEEKFTIASEEYIPQIVSRGLIEASRDRIRRGITVGPVKQAPLTAQAMFSFTALSR